MQGCPPTAQHRFSFGPWPAGRAARDDLGDATPAPTDPVGAAGAVSAAQRLLGLR